MGRGAFKEFDEQRVIDTAVDCFWARGFESTSVRDLACNLKSKEALMLKAVAIAVLAVGAMIGAAAAQDLGPVLGTKAPDIGMPQDQTGTPRSMTSLMGEKGVVLFFFRSTVW